MSVGGFPKPMTWQMPTFFPSSELKSRLLVSPQGCGLQISRNAPVLSILLVARNLRVQTDLLSGLYRVLQSILDKMQSPVLMT